MQILRELSEKWYEVKEIAYLQVTIGFILRHLTRKLGIKLHNQPFVRAWF